MFENRLKTGIFALFLIALLMMIGRAIDDHYKSNWVMIIAFIIGMGISFITFWNADKLIVKFYAKKFKKAPKNHALYKAVAKLSKEMNLPMPKTYIMDDKIPNAFTAGRNPQNAIIAATTGILDMLSQEELEGVIAHEFSHIKHRDSLIQAVTIGVVSTIGIIISMSQLFYIIKSIIVARDLTDFVFTLIILAAIPTIATIFQMTISRQREYMADAEAVYAIGNAKPLCNALTKLEKYVAKLKKAALKKAKKEQREIKKQSKNAMFMATLLSSHPSTKKRIEKMKAIVIPK